MRERVVPMARAVMNNVEDVVGSLVKVLLELGVDVRRDVALIALRHPRHLTTWVEITSACSLVLN